MKKLILFTLTTILLFNCSNGANEPCKDENCITDEQLTFFSSHIASITTKQELYEATTIDLSNKSITSLEAGIFDNLTSLIDLYLNDNELTSIPAEIGNLTSLTILGLHRNKLASIPTEIGNLTNLIGLSLSSNKLTSIPAGIFTKLTNLTDLVLKLSVDTNTFDCNRMNYDNWGLDATSLPTTFWCNN